MLNMKNKKHSTKIHETSMKLKQKYLRIHFLGISIHIRQGWLYRWLVRKILDHRMAQKLKKIQQKDKIRVAFLVAEASKWGYQSVYNMFNSNSRFETIILTTKLGQEHRNGKTLYQSMDDCRNFFESKGMRTESAYDEENKKYIPLNKFDVDIVFYEQPWDLVESQHPCTVSEHAITCYSSYGFDLMNYTGSYMENFHRMLDFVFTVSKATYKHIQNIAVKANNVHIVGWPKLDIYQDMEIVKTGKPLIIYAPHHSFEEKGLNLDTFQYNGQYILELAKQTADRFDWAFKPHPRLKHALVLNKIMTEQQADKYYGEWEKLGTLCNDGSYFELFSKSSAMITDCCSFLGEYLPTGNPVLHLINTKAQFNDVAKSFIGSFYQILDNKQLGEEFERVLVEKNDYKHAERMQKISLIFDKNEKAGIKIYKIITNLLDRPKDNR